MSQIDLGKLLGYTRVAVSKMERGITRLDISDLERIVAALGQPVGYFLEDAPPPPPRLLRERVEELYREIPEAIPIVERIDLGRPSQRVVGYEYWDRSRVAGRSIQWLIAAVSCTTRLVEEGDTVFFDTELSPQDGDLVVAAVGDRVCIEHVRTEADGLIINCGGTVTEID